MSATSKKVAALDALQTRAPGRVQCRICLADDDLTGAVDRALSRDVKYADIIATLGDPDITDSTMYNHRKHMNDRETS